MRPVVPRTVCATSAERRELGQADGNWAKRHEGRRPVHPGQLDCVWPDRMRGSQPDGLWPISGVGDRSQCLAPENEQAHASGEALAVPAPLNPGIHNHQLVASKVLVLRHPPARLGRRQCRRGLGGRGLGRTAGVASEAARAAWQGCGGRNPQRTDTARHGHWSVGHRRGRGSSGGGWGRGSRRGRIEPPGYVLIENPNKQCDEDHARDQQRQHVCRRLGQGRDVNCRSGASQDGLLKKRSIALVGLLRSGLDCNMKQGEYQ